ncbi:MAG: aquaporin [Christensenellaceae bacterium]|nr:aquaporin [Christensenellaceae bacterium]
MAGIVIGLTLAFAHIVGSPLTGTSVNPARSIGPALFAGDEALNVLWVFIVGPLVGAVLAALAYRYFKKALQ